MKEALDSRAVQEGGFRRFKELAQLYLELGKSEHEMPKTPQEIRTIYDKIMDGSCRIPSFPMERSSAPKELTLLLVE